MRRKYLLLLLIPLAIALGGCPCNKKHFAPPPEPNAPSNLTATAVSYKQIHLSWQDNSDDEDYFRVLCPTMWATQHQTIATLPANTTSYDHCNLQPMTEYEYYVCVHRGEEHTCSNTAYATTPCPVELSYFRAYFISNGLWAVEGTIYSRANEGCLVEVTCCLYNKETGQCLGTAKHKVYANAGEAEKHFYFNVSQEPEPESYPPCDYTVEITDVEIDY